MYYRKNSSHALIYVAETCIATKCVGNVQLAILIEMKVEQSDRVRGIILFFSQIMCAIEKCGFYLIKANFKGGKVKYKYVLNGAECESKAHKHSKPFYCINNYFATEQKMKVYKTQG